MTLSPSFNATADQSNVVTLDFAKAATVPDDGTRKNLRRMATQLGKKFGPKKPGE